jgi:hypothetical protein
MRLEDERYQREEPLSRAAYSTASWPTVRQQARRSEDGADQGVVVLPAAVEPPPGRRQSLELRARNKTSVLMAEDTTGTEAVARPVGDRVGNQQILDRRSFAYMPLRGYGGMRPGRPDAP